MKVATALFILTLVGMLLMAGVITFAVHLNGNVKASAKVGASSFDIETTDRRK